MRFTRCQITAASGRARCVSIKHASVRIATRVVAMLRQTAVTLFASFDKPVAADWRFEQLFWFVFEAVIHAMMESKIELVNAARAPMGWCNGWTWRWHNATIVGAIAVISVVLHSKVVTHFVSNCCSYNGNNFTVIHWDSTRELISTDRPLQGLSNHTAFKNFAGKKLCVVIRMIFHQIFFTIVEKTSERFVAIAWQIR